MITNLREAVFGPIVVADGSFARRFTTRLLPGVRKVGIVMLRPVNKLPTVLTLDEAYARDWHHRDREYQSARVNTPSWRRLRDSFWFGGAS